MIQYSRLYIDYEIHSLGPQQSADKLIAVFFI